MERFLENAVETHTISDEENSEDDEEIVSAQCEVYSNYKPVRLKLGVDHPQELCEGSGLSCVSPPKITYKLKMDPKYYQPRSDGKHPHLSNAQLEAVVYAAQSHQEFQERERESPIRLGFYLGDGTGTGKTRTLAAIIYENASVSSNPVLKTVWITCSVGLFANAEEELRHFVKQPSIYKIENLANHLREKKKHLIAPDDGKVKMLLATYRSLCDDGKRKLILKWMGADYDGLIIFDEAHNAKSAEGAIKKSTTGKKVTKLQDDFPNARIIYSTATGASEPHHILYMKRLRLWGKGTEYRSMDEFKTALESRGVAAMELLAMELKMRGKFVSRQISYNNVQVREEEAVVNNTFEAVYARCCEMWILLNQYLQMLKKQTSKAQKGGVKKDVASETGTFYATALQFFGSWILTSKLSQTNRVARKALKKGGSVVIGMLSTGDGKFKPFDKEEWVRGHPYSVLMCCLRRIMLGMGIPIGCPKAFLKDGSVKKIGTWTQQDEIDADVLPDKCWKLSIVRERLAAAARNKKHPQAQGNVPSTSKAAEVIISEPPRKKRKLSKEEKKAPDPESKFDYKFAVNWPGNSVGGYLCKEFKWLEDPSILSWSYNDVKANITPEGLGRLFHELALFLPINPIDELTHRLREPDRGMSYEVAEITGRKHRYLYNKKTEKWEKKKKASNKDEMNNFMNLKKRVCIISSAGSTGFSLHSDKSRPNQQQRTHIVVELSWSPDQLLQQLGRSHRSNQRSTPIYVILKSPVAGEMRFISVIAKRLRQLGAICQGHSLASPLSTILSDIICTKLGVSAINGAIRKLRQENPFAGSLMDAVGCQAIVAGGKQKSRYTKSAEKECSTCFNRSLMLPIDIQKRFMDLVFKNLLVLRSNEKALYLPIVEFPTSTTDIRKVHHKTVEGSDGYCHLWTFEVSRIASWDFVKQLNDDHQSTSRFYTKGEADVMFGIDKDNGSLEAYFPYNRNPKLMQKREVQQWKITQGTRVESVKSGWNGMIKKMQKHPGCFHSANGKSCRENCTFKWGIHQIFIVAGYTSQALSVLEKRSDNPFRLARVTFEDKAKTKKCVGLLVEKSRTNGLREAIRARFRQLKAEDSARGIFEPDFQDSAEMISSPSQDHEPFPTLQIPGPSSKVTSFTSRTVSGKHKKSNKSKKEKNGATSNKKHHNTDKETKKRNKSKKAAKSSL